MGETFFVNNEILIWARNCLNLDKNYVSKKLKLDLNVLDNIENGKEPVTYVLLEKFAKLYDRPLIIFFFNNPPIEATPAASFRTLPENAFYDFDPNMIKLFRKALTMQLNVKELEEDNEKFSNSKILDIVDNKMSLTDAAISLREVLNISLEEQKKSRKISDMLEIWRDAVNAAGIYIFKEAFKNEEYSGFCLYDETFPIIYINNSQSKSRQIFTVFHELAHIMYKTSGIDIINDESINSSISVNEFRVIEEYCNKFASEFLVPNKDFLSVIRQFDLSNMNIKDICERLSKLYKVSREFILRKIIDNNLISNINYEMIVYEWTIQAKEFCGKSGGDYYNTKISYLGRNYLDTALRNYYSKKIGKLDLANYLDVKYKSLDKMTKRYIGE